MDRRWLLLSVVAGALGVGAAWAHPFTMAPDSAFTGGHIVAFAIARAELLRGNLGAVTMLAGAPTGVEARTLLWPMNLVALFVGPVFAYNLLNAAIPTLNALGGARLGKALGMDRRAATVLALLLAVNPWVLATMRNGQVEQAVIGGAAWMWAAAIGGAPLELGLVTLGLGLAAPHVTLAGLLGLPLLTRSIRAYAGVALALVGIVAWHAPGLAAKTPQLFAPFQGGDGGGAAPAPKHALFAWELVWPAPPPPVRIRPVVHMGYVGLPLLIAALLGARRRWVFAAIGGVAAVLALGVLPLDAVPMVGRSATPYRFVLALVVAAATLAAPLRHAWVLVPIVWIESLVVDRRAFPMPPADYADDGVPLPDDGGLVLDLPAIGPSCRNASTHHLLAAARSGHPVPSVLRDGPAAFPYAAPAAMRLDQALRASPCSPDLRDAVDAFAPAHVVAHLHPPCRLPVQAPACLAAALGPPSGQDGRTMWWIRSSEP